MNTHSPEDAPSPSPHIHLSTSSSGYSVPIRAPLTIDSDSELDLPISHQIYSRTSSFNSSSSIDISSYGEEEESGGFEAYPYGEIVIERSCVEESCFSRPFVRYPDGNYVKERGNVSQSAIFRPFVRIPCEESGGGGSKLSVPIAPLTGDFDDDGESDIDSVDGGGVQKVAMAPKVRSFDDGDEGDCGVDDELRVEGVFSGEDIIGTEFLGEIVKLSESGASRFDLERIDVQTVLSSHNEIETETVNEKVSELDEMCFDLERMYAHVVSNSDSEIEILNSVSAESIDEEGCKVECLNEVVKFSETGALNFVSDRINSLIVSNSDSEIENLNYVSSESIDDERCKVECLNEVVKLSDAGASRFDLERIESQAVSSSIHEKLSESDELCFGSDIIDTQIVSSLDSEIEHLNTVPTESIANEGCKVECLNEVVKLSDSSASSFDLEIIDEQIVSNSDSEIELKTINETEQEAANKKKEEMLTRMQRVRAKFLRLALNEQLTREVNGEGSNYKFDFHLTILAVGKTGVGKSATINTIFGENRATTNAFDPGTTTIQELTGNVDGIQLRVIDTPGLKCSSSDLSYNLRVLKSIKRFTRRHTPDVVLYVDRLDTREVNDLHLLKLITGSLGSSVWCHCIIALTHAGYDPLNEPSGAFVVQRCRFIQEQIFSCGGENRRMANPVWLVENHLSHEHDIMDLDCGLKSLACLDQANEDEGCDQVPPFDPLSEPQDIVNRSRERRDAYFADFGYRVKLLGNNTWSLGCRLCF